METTTSNHTSKTIIMTSRQSYRHGVGHRGLAKGEQGPRAFKNAEVGHEGIANGSTQHADGRLAATLESTPKAIILHILGAQVNRDPSQCTRPAVDGEARPSP